MPETNPAFRPMLAQSGSERCVMRLTIAVLVSVGYASISFAQNTASQLSIAEQAAIFKAAGFTQNGKQWTACGDPGTDSYTPGAIETVKDLNGDGRPDAIVTEGSVYCFGSTETGYALVSKQANGSWKLITGGQGIPNFLTAKGVDGWPDIEVGGPGFCFPVNRWNGKKYVLNRHEYEGKPCRPNS